MDILNQYRILLYIIGIFLFCVVILPFILKEIRKKKESKKLSCRIIPVSSLSEEDIARIECHHPSGKKIHPQVNISVCVGCGTCVATCKEKTALYILNGKSTLVDPFSCKGHGDCADACPTEANQLIEYGKRANVKVPEIDDNFESNVMGIYVVGSLTGAGLIKEAINQGRAVVNHIMKDVFPDKMPHVMIIGAGPAGLSSLLSCHKFGLQATCLEKEDTANTVKNFPKNKIIMAEPVELPIYGPLWVGNTTREKLLSIWEGILKKTKVEISVGSKLESVKKKRGRFVILASGQEYFCDKVIVATGVRGEPLKLNVPGEEAPHVFYNLIDANEFAGKRVAIAGAGDTACEAGLTLLTQKCRVSMVVRGEGFPKAKERNQERMKEAAREGSIKFHFNSHVKEIKRDSLIISGPQGTEELGADFVFVLIGGKLPYELLKNIGIRMVDKEI